MNPIAYLSTRSPLSIISRTVFALSFIFLAACSSSVTPCEDPFFNQTLSKSRFGGITHEANAPLSIVAQSWCTTLHTQCRLHIFDSEEPMALSTKVGEIYLSQGLIDITEANSELLLFVITHELAHGMLGHFSLSCGAISELEREQQADAHAVFLLYKKAKNYKNIPEFLTLLSSSSQLDKEGRRLLQRRAERLQVIIGTLH